MRACDHCGTSFAPRDEQDVYCCRGCGFVAEMIREEGLGRFYDLKSDRVVAPVKSRPFEQHDFSWLESLVVESDEVGRERGVARLDCAVEGISCVGCVWLIEKVFLRHEGAVLASANPATGSLHLEWQAGNCGVVEFVEELANFGYVAAPMSQRREAPERRQLAMRMGLCGAFSLNAMGFSLPGYFGMEETFEYARLFQMIAWISATLSMLVGGSYFAGKAWRALRMGQLHIDLPIALGVFAAYVGSVLGMFLGEGHDWLYFDFVATFTFLMLVGRYVQTAAVERNRLRLLRRSPLPSEWVGRDGGEISLEKLVKGSEGAWEPGKALPIAAMVAEGEGEASLEWIYGEADPVVVREGMHVPAGAILLSRKALRVVGDEAWGDSLLSSLVECRDGGESSVLFQRLLRIYLMVVILLGVGTLVGWSFLGDWKEGFQAMISVFVVSCPCALGVAVPLADEMAAARLARAGAFVRHASLWARLKRVRTLFLDKTGTLTLERPTLRNPEVLVSLDEGVSVALAWLTRDSLHPISRSLLEELGLRGQGLLAKYGVREVVEFAGRGVECWDGGTRWYLGKDERGVTGETLLVRQVGGGEEEILARFAFVDAVRPGAVSALARLRRRGISLVLCSGDAVEKVEKMAGMFEIPLSCAYGGLSPSEKAEKVRAVDEKDTMFLGDGANDALAVEAAYVSGTPVVDRSMLEGKVDFYALGAGFEYLPRLFDVAELRNRGVRRAFCFALVYNVVVIALSIVGKMEPRIAAVLMPLSSLVAIFLVSVPERVRRG